MTRAPIERSSASGPGEVSAGFVGCGGESVGYFPAELRLRRDFSGSI